MNRKTVVFSALAVATMVLVIAASAVAVFAFTVDSQPAQVDAVTIDEAPALDVAPVNAEISPQFDKPGRSYEHARSGDCNYSKAQLQLTEAPVSQPDEQAPLAQVDVQ